MKNDIESVYNITLKKRLLPKNRFRNYLYIEGMPEDKNNVAFYVKHGFSEMKNGAAIQIVNLADKR